MRYATNIIMNGNKSREGEEGGVPQLSAIGAFNRSYRDFSATAIANIYPRLSWRAGTASGEKSFALLVLYNARWALLPFLLLSAQSKKFEESRSFVSFCHSRLSTRDFGARSLARRAIIGDFRFCCSAGLCMTLNGVERFLNPPPPFMATDV